MNVLFRVKLPILALGLVAAGCLTDPDELAKRAADIEMVKQRTDADKLFVVDCLLPAQIRQLGSMVTYLAARRPIKTTAIDCELKGGEYVAYDQANTASALQIWLPKAQAGDAEAQTYVGEIYQKGNGLQPDYKTAAQWFLKAAEQGNSRAQINLGYLYEKGMGVPRDISVATSWYQKASGLQAKDIPYAATINTGADNENELQAEIKLLKTELNKSRAASKELEKQLAQSQGQLQESLEKLEGIQSEKDQAQSALEVAQAQGDTVEKGRLEQVLKEKDEVLFKQEQVVSSLKSEYEAKVGDLTKKLEETEKRAKQIHTQLKNQETATDDTQLKLVDAQAKLADIEKKLLESQQSFTKAKEQASIENATRSNEKDDSARQKDIDKIQQQLALSEKERERAKSLIEQLEAEKQKFEQEIESLKKSAPTVASGNKPVIEIIDPPFTIEEGKPTAKVRAVDTRDIIGKVTSTAGILSVMVNDLKSAVDDRGIFNAPIETKQEKTTVNVVAIDRNGLRESLSFLLFLQDLDQLDGDETSATRADSGESRQKREIWTDIDFGKYYALIIGNNDYRKLPKLDTPGNDARGVDEVLRTKYGFDTQLLIDADRYQILSAMNDLRGKLTENDNLLIYYAGHGELDQVNMRGHWLPVDADADNNANWISTVSITDILNTMASRHILVIADSCYSGAMTRSSVARLQTGMTAEKKSEWLKAMLKAKSRTVLTSGGLEPVLDGGGGDHSVFANALLKALKSSDGLLEGQQLYHDVSANVVAVAANFEVEQVPQYAPVSHAGHEAGEFFFIPKAN